MIPNNRFEPSFGSLRDPSADQPERYAATPRQQGTPQSEMLENVQRQEMTKQ